MPPDRVTPVAVKNIPPEVAELHDEGAVESELLADNLFLSGFDALTKHHPHNVAGKPSRKEDDGGDYDQDD